MVVVAVAVVVGVGVAVAVAVAVAVGVVVAVVVVVGVGVAVAVAVGVVVAVVVGVGVAVAVAVGVLKLMLTLSDFVHELVSRAGPNARVVFKGGDDELELDAVQALSPATEVTVRLQFDSSLKKTVARLENEVGALEDGAEDREFKLRTLVELAKEKEWDAVRILKELEGL